MAGDTVMFIDREYTRDEIYDLVGGGSKQSYLPTSVRSICCLPTVRPVLTVASGDSGVSTI